MLRAIKMMTKLAKTYGFLKLDIMDYDDEMQQLFRKYHKVYREID